MPTGQGFSKSLKLDCTTAQTSYSGDQLIAVVQRIEGQNLQYLKYGTSSAESLTLSFWVKSNKTGTYTLELDQAGNGKDYSQTYTISSANTWEKKTLTFNGDTATALANDNTEELEVNFWLAASSNFTSGTLNTSWNSTVNANRVSSSQVNIADSTSNEWYVTGVQLEAGTSASDFEFLPHDVNLQRCQRYYEKSYSPSKYAGDTSSEVGALYYNPSGTASYHSTANCCFKTLKRAIPTVVIYNPVTGGTGATELRAGSDNVGMDVANTNEWGFGGNVANSSVGTGSPIRYQFTAESEL